MKRSDCESEDFSDTETVPFDTEVPDGYTGFEFPCDVHDELDGDAELESDALKYYEDTQPVDDNTFSLADAYETQKVDDLEGETQVVDDIEGETQAVNLGSDTQVVDDSDGQKSDETEVLCDTQKISDDDSERKDGTRSGFTVRGFTSIRVASTRQSGLAARKSGINNVSQKTESEKNDTPVKELRNGNTGKFGCSAARKLFMDDVETEILQAGDDVENSVDSGGMPEIGFQHDLEGLSYINSQEPGDLSQAYALDVVNRFLELNPVEDDRDITCVGSIKGKSKPVSIAKGTQSLAKKATLRSIDEERGAFKWDDNVEDEGGGEFFQKKKELFFEKDVAQRKRSIGKSKKTSCLKSKRSLTAPQNRGRKQIGSNIKLNDAIFSDSRILAKNSTAVPKSSELKEPKFQKNLLEELNAEMDITEDRLIEAGCDESFPKNQDVGIDTQMAADAMEALQFAVSATKDAPSQFNEGTGNVTKCSDRNDVDDELQSLNKSSIKKRALGSKSKVVPRQSKRTKGIEESRRRSTRSSLQQSQNVGNQSRVELSVRKSRRVRGELKGLVVDLFEKSSSVCRVVESRKKDEVPVPTDHCEVNRATVPSGRKSLKTSTLQKEIGSFTSVTHRTRSSIRRSWSKGEDNQSSSAVQTNVSEPTRSSIRRSKSKGEDNQSSSAVQTNVSEPGDVNLSQDQSDTSFRRKRTYSELPDVHQRGNTQYSTRSRRSKTDTTGGSLDADRTISEEMVDKDNSHIKDGIVKAQTSRHSGKKRNVGNVISSEREKASRTEEASPIDRSKPYAASDNTTPISSTTSINAASPICMGDEYLKQSCRKNLLSSSFMKGLSRTEPCPESTSATKDLRKRRDFGEVRAIFSRHLDPDITKQQKKILARFGASVASSMSDATHFITDKFVRTNNMLEAIVYSKPVVTQLWLESCVQANCFIDEKAHVLRDAKKEREFGFSMPVSLSRAREHPLLQGLRVLITPNTKPSREILAGLVKAVHGLAVERIGRSVLNSETFPDDILVLSCEEDYEVCVPFLEKGAAAYSSELLLNGIVTQRLDYERHRLFVDRVKRTRSTIWLKKNGNKYLPVNKT